MAASAPDFLTTTELATLLRIKQRKVYDLAASGEIPCTRAMGKLLFPRTAVQAWLAEHGSGTSAGIGPAGGVEAGSRPNVFLGSHDPLLDWALRESRSGLATFFDGSLDGLERFVGGEGIATGLHLPAADGAGEAADDDAPASDPPSSDPPASDPPASDPPAAWNRSAVVARCGGDPVVLVEWAWRERGLITPPGNPRRLTRVGDLAGLRFVPRQPEAGAQVLFQQLASASGVTEAEMSILHPARSEADAALAVVEERADAALGLAAIAHQYRLGFVPLVRERFDLLVWRKSWFDDPMQRLLAFCSTRAFAAKAKELTGYDIAGLGRVHFNGP